MEGVEVYQGKVVIDPDKIKVYLSRGNFIFDINTIIQKYTGEIIKVTITKGDFDAV